MRHQSYLDEPNRFYSELPEYARRLEPEDRSKYLNEQMHELERTRAYDAHSHVNWEETYVTILQDAQAIPHLRNYRYILDITSPKRPKLKLVHKNTGCSTNELGWEEIQQQRQKDQERNEIPQKKKRGMKYMDFRTRDD